MRANGADWKAAAAAALRGLRSSASISRSTIVSSGAHVSEVRKRAFTVGERIARATNAVKI